MTDNEDVCMKLAPESGDRGRLEGLRGTRPVEVWQWTFGGPPDVIGHLDTVQGILLKLRDVEIVWDTVTWMG